ncbi:protein vac14 homolog [Plakobranchus ocellatus]|uniref:Protein vac14 homolog n=1 Tax=Plakobranchus ocellatus TaxID=259542 RepID=A0AAV3Z9J0_9GAST|nr:protein vac14 homolog [Plakobranchus ocellatus]
MLRIPWTAKKTNERVLNEANKRGSLVRRKRQATFLGHVMRRGKLEHLVTTGKIVKDLISAKQFDQIKKLLKVLEEFASSQNPNTSKGGLIGLAAVAIGLGKVARGAILPHFNEVFDGPTKDIVTSTFEGKNLHKKSICKTVCCLMDDLIQFTAISWLREFILLAGRSMLPHVAGILNAVLPCLSYSDEGRKSAMIQLEIPSVIKVLQRLLGHETIQTRVAALKWFNLLLVKTPNKTFRHIDLLMTALADPSDDVVLLDVEVLSQISSNPAGFGLPDNKTVHPPSQEKSSRSDKSAGELKLNPFFTRLMNGLVDFRGQRSFHHQEQTIILRLGTGNNSLGKDWRDTHLPRVDKGPNQLNISSDLSKLNHPQGLILARAHHPQRKAVWHHERPDPDG